MNSGSSAPLLPSLCGKGYIFRLSRCGAFTTGEPGGKETGQSVTHYIFPGGAYATAYAKLEGRGFQLHWQSAPAA